MDSSLSGYVENNLPVSLHNLLLILHDVSQGMCYLHGLDPLLIHRDLAPHNILVKTARNSVVAKISDWMTMPVVFPARKKKFEEYKSKPTGSLEFIPPEVLFSKTP